MALAILSAESIANAHEEHPKALSGEAAVQALTDALLKQERLYRRAPSRQKSQRLRVLRELAKERKARVVALAHEQPAACVRLALAPETRKALPFTLQQDIEARVTRRGMMEVVIEDDFVHPSRIIHSLRDPRGRLRTLHFGAPPAKALMSGDRVQVSGVAIDQHLALVDGGAASLKVLAEAPPPETVGEQRAVVLLVNFQDHQAQIGSATIKKNRLASSVDLSGVPHPPFCLLGP